MHNRLNLPTLLEFGRRSEQPLIPHPQQNSSEFNEDS